MAVYPVGYPPELVPSELLPDIAARPVDYLGALTRPIVALDDEIRLIYAGLTDLGDAVGSVLDLAGGVIGETRGGLSDSEYRRILAGRRAARTGGTTPAAVLAGWIALTEGADATADAPGAATVRLRARVSYAPTSVWLRRARGVVLDLVAAGMDVDATLYRAGTAVYDGVPGYDAGTYAWSL